MRKAPGRNRGLLHGADDEARTRDLNLGKVALYQLSYVRTAPWRESNYTQPGGCAGRADARRSGRRTPWEPGRAGTYARCVSGGGQLHAGAAVSGVRGADGAREQSRTRLPGASPGDVATFTCAVACPGAVKSVGRAGTRKSPGPEDRGFSTGADDEARTRDLNLGKVALYQLSYVRTAPDRLPPIGASTSLPDPQEWSGRPVPERVTGIAHCAFPLEGGCSTTELHPHAPRDPAFRPRPSACPRH